MRVLQCGIGLVVGNLARLAATIFAVPAPGFLMASFLHLFSIELLAVFPLVEPGFGRVLLLFFVPAGEQAAKVFGIAEVFTHQHCRIRVVQDVVVKILIVLQNVIDDAAEEQNVGPGAQRYPDVSCG